MNRKKAVRWFLYAPVVVLSFTIVIVPLALDYLYGDDQYECDYRGTDDVYVGRYTNALSAVYVYVTGPARYFSNAGIDDLLSMKPLYKTTDDREIKQVLMDLSCQNNRSGHYPQMSSTRAQGHTCHIVLMDFYSKKYMLFRVFLPQCPQKVGLDLYPKSSSGFGDENFRLLPWLTRIGAMRGLGADNREQRASPITGGRQETQTPNQFP